MLAVVTGVAVAWSVCLCVCVLLCPPVAFEHLAKAVGLNVIRSPLTGTCVAPKQHCIKLGPGSPTRYSCQNFLLIFAF